MALDQAANFVRGGVDSSITSGDTTISVDDASTFPDPSSSNYNLVLWDSSFNRPGADPNVEIVRVTARDTTNDDLTVTRAQEGTSDVDHPDTSVLQMAWTAKMRDDTQSEINSAGTVTDSGNDTDGGDDYQFPNAADNLDLQSDGEILNAQAVTTADASITNAPTGDNDGLRWQEGVETGAVTADGVDNSAGNDDWGQSADVTVSETFGNAFSATPRVACSADLDDGARGKRDYTHNVQNKSTTGFDVKFYHMVSTDESAQADAYAVSYVASEGR